jgi:hypothetical protein
MPVVPVLVKFTPASWHCGALEVKVTVGVTVDIERDDDGVAANAVGDGELHQFASRS